MRWSRRREERVGVAACSMMRTGAAKPNKLDCKGKEVVLVKAYEVIFSREF